MNDFDDLDTYNEDPVHDGWVDFDFYEYSDELINLFEETDLEQFIYN